MLTDQLMELLSKYLFDLINLLLGVAFSWLALKIKTYFANKDKNGQKAQIAKTVVLAVEQMYKDLHGEQKLEKGLEMASAMLAEAKIKVTSTELRALIESALAQFNGVFDVEVEESEE